MLIEELAGSDVVMLWGWEGPVSLATEFVDDYRMTLPMLADEDRTLHDAYAIREDNGDAFALYPRHFVIDREGNLAYASAQVAPSDLLQAIRDAD